MVALTGEGFWLMLRKEACPSAVGTVNFGDVPFESALSVGAEADIAVSCGPIESEADRRLVERGCCAGNSLRSVLLAERRACIKGERVCGRRLVGAGTDARELELLTIGLTRAQKPIHFCPLTSTQPPFTAKLKKHNCHTFYFIFILLMALYFVSWPWLFNGQPPIVVAIYRHD